MRIKTDKQGDIAPSTRPFQYARKMPIFGAILLLLLMSILIAGCGTNNTATQAGADEPKPTATIRFNNNNLSPTPTLPPNWCGIWVVNASPYYSSNGTITVYGKFSANNNGNPVGIAGAAVNMNVQWGDLTQDQLTATTTANGLATVTLKTSGHYAAINKLSLITAQFNSGNQSCSVDQSRPASFTLIQGASPTKKGTTTATGDGNTGGGRKKN